MTARRAWRPLSDAYFLGGGATLGTFFARSVTDLSFFGCCVPKISSLCTCWRDLVFTSCTADFTSTFPASVLRPSRQPNTNTRLTNVHPRAPHRMVNSSPEYAMYVPLQLRSLKLSNTLPEQRQASTTRTESATKHCEPTADAAPRHQRRRPRPSSPLRR